ncbi:GNAT family N-acetyltransferase [Nocardioides sp. HM23]|uniref:GNAT family N-acetyltransferase n=1 Tax=Nocardioides bizhenqiangii TaxID=3095076 RepID=UPI002ACA6EE0|nr:GNAT family N-acetyltransferase [Nocardioides sp. HM23]MDZ5623615.1 GNAT family N-acetyltransferase [Nocardioides sp. HM23]
MTSAHDPRDPGQHLLGPHVVGQRIVVRRLLRGETGPSGGPAMTDLLGVCIAWGDGRCVVQPEDGEPVEIAIGDIVSGKPVPPRPSVRMRVSAREAELHTASLWATVETVPLGEWVLRTDTAPVGRLRRRGNSCLAMGDPGLPFEAAAAAVRQFYDDRGRSPYVQVEAGSPEEDAFVAAGWEVDPTGDAEHRLASLTQVRRLLRAAFEPTSLVADGPRAVATIAGRARGEAAVDGDWIGVHAIEVDPAHRRQGLATAVLGELLEWGAEQGATTVWLHVETDNAPALAWYDGLGLAPHHTCRYLTAPSAASRSPSTR